MNTKILELVSHNNVLLLEKIREVEENCGKQLKEKDEQIKRSINRSQVILIDQNSDQQIKV